MPTIIEANISLPHNFRIVDFLTFYQRDEQMVGEVVHKNQLNKGIFWQGSPACITFTFTKSLAKVNLHIDLERKKLDVEKSEFRLRQLAQHMLGLNQETEHFEKFVVDHPQLNRLITRQSGLRVPQAATTFEALTWAIIGQ